MTRRLVVAAVCVTALGGRALGAQTANWLAVGASANRIRLQTRFATGASSDVSGSALGASGDIRRGPVALALGYWQGRVDADPAGTQQQDVIDGYALLDENNVVQNRHLGADDHVAVIGRSFDSDGGDQLEGPLVSVATRYRLWVSPV